MHFAAAYGHFGVVKALASLANVNVNAASNNGMTPLHFAAADGHTDVVNALVSLPNVNANATSNHVRQRCISQL